MLGSTPWWECTSLTGEILHSLQGQLKCRHLWETLLLLEMYKNHQEFNLLHGYNSHMPPLYKTFAVNKKENYMPDTTFK